MSWHNLVFQSKERNRSIVGNFRFLLLNVIILRSPWASCQSYVVNLCCELSSFLILMILTFSRDTTVCLMSLFLSKHTWGFSFFLLNCPLQADDSLIDDSATECLECSMHVLRIDIEYLVPTCDYEAITWHSLYV